MYRPHVRDTRSLYARIDARISARLGLGATILPGLLLLAACDIPTALPKWDTTFIVQSENTTLAAAQLLPASVTITDGEFAISVSPVSFSQDLASLCASCAALAGQGGSRPAFLGSFESPVALPADVAGATLAAGRLNVTLSNGFSFDPLRADGDMGKLTIKVRSDGALVGTQVVSGTDAALPPGGKLVVAVPVQGNVSGKMDVSVEVSAPADDDAFNGTGTLDVTVHPSGLRATAARFSVQSRHVTAAPVQLKLADIESGVINRTRSGAFLLSFTNPLGVSGTLTLTLRVNGATRTISKPVVINTGDSEVEVPFDAADLKAFLGRNATMSLAGSVSSSQSVTLTPTQQVMSVAARLKLTLGPKE